MNFIALGFALPAALHNPWLHGAALVVLLVCLPRLLGIVYIPHTQVGIIEKIWSSAESRGSPLPPSNQAASNRLFAACMSGTRKSNTGPDRFLVVEFDFNSTNSTEEGRLLERLAIEGQDLRDLCAALLLHLAEKAPLALAVYSGGKSLHGWFYCAGIAEEKVLGFFGYAVSLGADSANWNRSQFARMPDGLRENGKRQAVYFFNPG